MGPLDRSVFYAINRWPESLNPVFYFFSEATKQPLVRIALLMMFVLLVAWKRSRAAALLAAATWPIANEATDLLKAGFQMARPCVELPDAIVRVQMLTSFGTASAHSANMAAVAFCFLRYFRPLGWAWAAVALMTGLSRVYVGVHYPSQVVLGWTVGASIAWGATQIYESIARRRRRGFGACPAGPTDECSDSAGSQGRPDRG